MSNEEFFAAVVELLIASERTNVRLEAKVHELERVAVYWEREAVLRAATIANDLTLRTRQAEIEALQIRTEVSALVEQDLSLEALRARLLVLGEDF